MNTKKNRLWHMKNPKKRLLKSGGRSMKMTKDPNARTTTFSVESQSCLKQEPHRSKMIPPSERPIGRNRRPGDDDALPRLPLLAEAVRFPGPAGGAKSSKIWPLAELSSRDETLDFGEVEDKDLDFDNLTIGGWKSSKPKRLMLNWLPKIEEGEGFDRDFEHGGLRSWSNEEIHSPEKLGVGQSRRWMGDEIELVGEPETDRNGAKDGVNNWLNGLGLRSRRYWPAFEIHEVDEEVLPLLTFKDLKELRITNWILEEDVQCH